MTELPYSFDLLYDIKTLDQLIDHLSGKCRYPVSATDFEILETCAEHGITLPIQLEQRLQDDMIRNLVPEQASLLVLSQIEKQLIKVQESIWDKKYQPMFKSCESYEQAAKVADNIVAEVKGTQGKDQVLPAVIRNRLMQEMAQYGKRYVRSRRREMSDSDRDESPNQP